jgi:hypothetical protein
MPGIFDWISNGISTAVQPFTNWLQDPRGSNTSRPRLTSSDPTQVIDGGNPGVGILNFPHDRPKYYMSFAFEEYSRPNQFQGLESRGLTDYIALPLPNNMKDVNSITYNTQKGHIIAEGISDLMNGDYDSLKTGGVDGLKTGLGKLLTVGGETATGWGVHKVIDGLNAGASLIKEDGLVDSGLQIAGLADNPFMTVALKGPEFKPHMFTWRLAPKSPEESRTIKKIIDTLKKMAYPELLTLGAGGFFKYPHIVWPKFQPDSVMDFTYKFKPCVITNLNFQPLS